MTMVCMRNYIHKNDGITYLSPNPTLKLEQG